MLVQIHQNILATQEALIIPIVQNDKLKDVLSKLATIYGLNPLLLQTDFKAHFKEVLTLYPTAGNIPRLYLIGVGEKIAFSEILKTFRSFAYQFRAKLPTHLAIDFSSLKNGQLARWVEASVNGILLGRYDVSLYKTIKNGNYDFLIKDISIDIVAEESIEQHIDRGIATAETQLRIFDLINAPSNKKIPATLADWAVDSGKKYDYTTKVYDQAQLKKMGMESLLAVNKGSEHDAALIVAEYKPKTKQKLTKVGLVGKGVTFDTGGISIKPSTNMHFMKSDMGGAAAVLGTVELVAKLKLPVHLVGVVVSTENCVDGKSIKPGDVISSYSGKTIEVIDTDAEGRLILADGLSYILKNHKPDILIDLATLTGSCIQTFGYQCAGLFCNDDELADRLFQKGEICGERVWRMPIWDAYKEEMNSDIADIKNLATKPLAGAITAAKFLEFFIENHPKWAHLDIAGVSFMDSEFATTRTATAYGIRLLIEFLSDQP